jgi:hypothetical protein
MDAWADAGIAVERAKANSDLGVVRRIAAEQRGAAVGAEPFLGAALRAPRTETVLALYHAE